MARASAYRWEFRARFRRHAFGWRSQPAIKRVKEAVAEIKQVARTDRLLAAEGAVLFLEKVSPALERVDSSSGAIGAAVNRAVAALVEIIAAAPADQATRERWLEHLWDAYQDDQVPYIEALGECWGELCGSPAIASRWADNLLETCRMAWGPDPSLRGYFAGSVNCLSALLAAGRHDELLALLNSVPCPFWHYHQFGVQALVAQGKVDQAIAYAEANVGLNDSPTACAQACEQALLSAGRLDEAYDRYAPLANRSTTHAAWFRAVARKYPHKRADEILAHLVAATPGEEGKWFAAAKDAGLYDQAIALARLTPCSPQTLSRAARDFAEKNPGFALEAGMTALSWLVEGYGYDITSDVVLSAYAHTLAAAEHAGCLDATHTRIRELVAGESMPDRFVSRVLGSRLGLSP